MLKYLPKLSGKHWFDQYLQIENQPEEYSLYLVSETEGMYKDNVDSQSRRSAYILGNFMNEACFQKDSMPSYTISDKN